RQGKEQIDLFVVGGIEIDRILESDHGAGHVVLVIDAAMRYGHAVPQPGRSQPLALAETVENISRTGAAGSSSQQAGHLLQQTLLARSGDVDCNAFGGEHVNKLHEFEPLPLISAARYSASAGGELRCEVTLSLCRRTWRSRLSKLGR